MKHIQITFTNKEEQLWYVPQNSIIEEELKDIEEQEGLTIDVWEMIKND